MDSTLQDVSNAIQSRRQSTFKRLWCFVVNYTADNDFPHKFFYNGCSVSMGNGMYCARANCEHGSKFSRHMYRFQLQLTDQSPEPPVTITIFDSGHILMGISAEQLSQRSPEAQLAMVREKTSNGKPFDFYLKVKEDSYSGEFVGVVQMMFHVDSNEDKVLNELMKTPSSFPRLARSHADFHTPGLHESTIGSTSVGDSSAQRRGGSCSRSNVSNVKMKLQEFVDIIDLTTRTKLADYLETIDLSDD